MRTRSTWRRRWVSLGVLTLLVGLVGAVVLTTAAGSRRTRSSIDRAAAEGVIPNAYVVLSRPDLGAAERIARLPQVRIGGRIALMGLFSRNGYAIAGSPIDPTLGDRLFRSVLLRGRRADPANPLEITLPESNAAKLGLDVGDRLDVASPSAEQWACLDPAHPQSPGCAQVSETFVHNPLDLSSLGGEHLRLRVVGIDRTLFDVGARSSDTFFNLLTPAFFEKYGNSMHWGATVFVRYRPGVTDERFEAALSRAVPREQVSDIGTFTAIVDALHSTVGVLANGLLVFSGVAGLVGFAAIAQALARQARSGAAERDVLRSCGATRAERALDSVAPLVPVALMGSVLAIAVAWFASRWMPIGTARAAEPSPGYSFDTLVLLGGGLLLAAGFLLVGTGAVMWVDRRRVATRAKASAMDRLAVGSVAATTAARMVSNPGTGRRSVPIRSAIAGIALATAGLVGVTVFSASLTRLEHGAVRQGWGWDVLVKGGRSDDSGLDYDVQETIRKRQATIEADPDVVGVTEIWIGYEPRVAGHTVPGYAEHVGEGGRGFVIIDGRAPMAADEMALGEKSLRRTGAAIGDTVTVEKKRMRVVGTAVFPGTGDQFGLADGSLFTDEGVRALALGSANSDSSSPPEFAVTIRPGADRSAVMKRLAVFNFGDTPTRRQSHAEVEQLGQLDRLPLILAGFLLAVGLLAAGHALALMVKVRAKDLGVIRTLGATSAQTTRMVTWQGTYLAVAGCVIGIPCGLVLGHLVWGLVADAYGVQTDSAWPWLTVAAILMVTVALTDAIAWFFGRRAGRRGPGTLLRTSP